MNDLYGDQADEMRRRFADGADLAAFQNSPFILIKRGNRTRSLADQYFSRYRFKPKVVLETENTVTTLAMAQAGMGITICPELFLRAQPTSSHAAGDVDVFPLNDPSIVSKLVAGYRQDRYLPHYAERFIEITRQALTPTNT